MAKDDDCFGGNPRLKKAGVKIEWTPERIQEYVKCVRDPVYFINNYVKIISLDHGIIPFKMWSFQEDFVKRIHENRFNVAKYGRRSGKTATTSAYLLWSILFNKNFKVGILANKHTMAKKIVATMQLAYEYLPNWLQQGILTWNKSEFILENGSSVFSNSTSSSAIRGDGLNILYIDEFAFVPQNIQEEFFTSAYPTITSGSTTKIVITSTPNGMDYFYKIWKESENGKNPFIRSEVHWSEIPGRDDAWYEEQMNLLGSLKFSQEYGVEFLGSSMTLISGSKLGMIPYIDPTYETVDGLRYYAEVNREHNYVLVADTGHGEGLDYSAYLVIDVSTVPFTVVCTFRNNTISPIIYPKYIMEAAVYYNNCQVLVETNDLGQQVVDILQEEMEYEGLLATANRTRSQEISAGFGASTKYGVRTTKQVKRLGCSTFKSIIESNQMITNDFNLLQEMHKFSYKNGTYQADSGNDDLVMCGVLFAWLSSQSYFREITDTNIHSRVYQSANIDDYMLTPFGLVSDGQEKSSYNDGKDIWTDI